ncbi:MAG TPA: hypothetical protein DCO68_13570 [Methylophilaceae bacterium]|nr:hypothetical protein [Methylophilaceae bacterium]
MNYIVSKYRYRTVSREETASALFHRPINITEHNSLFENVHLGVGAMMPNDLSPAMLGEMAQLITTHY